MEINCSKRKLTIKGKDNRLYNLEIIKEDDEITFKSNLINNIWDIKYILNLDIKDFYKINEAFRKYDSINEVYSKYFKGIKEEQISINSNENKIILFFNDNNKVKIPFILESNDKKIFNVIRKLCDKMEDIDTLKNELDQQKIENANLKIDLEKRRNEDAKIMAELRKENENLKKEISSSNRQKELYYIQLGELVK